MHVDHPEARHRQQRVGNQLTVGRHDAKVGPQRRELAGHGRIAQGGWLQHCQAAFHGQRLDGPRGHLLSSATRPVGLGDDAGDLVAGTEQRLEGGHREPGRAEEHDAQGHHFPVRSSFLIFRTMRSFWSPRSRSTKSVPSR